MKAEAGGQGDRVLRHRLVDRLYHWSMAACVLILLGTAFAPVLGWRFEWLQLHWTTGILLALLVVLHLLRSLPNWRDMAFGRVDLTNLLTLLRADREGALPRVRLAKYAPAQKLYHAASAGLVLAVIITGALMLLKIDTPWWQRDPYLLAPQTWGLVYVVHGLGSLCLVPVIMVHVYFAARPEKRRYTRSMILGWITAEEWRLHQTAEQDARQDRA